MTDVFTTLRIRISPKSLIRGRSRFESSDELDAALRGATAQPGVRQEAAVVLSWVNGMTFFGRIELVHERYGGWSAHVLELCTQIEKAPKCRSSWASRIARGLASASPLLTSTSQLPLHGPRHSEDASDERERA